jgi:RimJ/RimL family protein N-acetyltransferase
VTLWVVEANARARRFYERQGFRPDGSTKTARMSGTEAIEVRYRMSLP